MVFFLAETGVSFSDGNLFSILLRTEALIKPLITLLICHFTYRYIYIPMGGSQCSVVGMLFSTAITFAFVSYWHGGHNYLWYWAALNWLGVTAENGVKRLLSVSLVRDLIVSWIPLCFTFIWSSRFCGVDCVCAHARFKLDTNRDSSQCILSILPRPYCWRLAVLWANYSVLQLCEQISLHMPRIRSYPIIQIQISLFAIVHMVYSIWKSSWIRHMFSLVMSLGPSEFVAAAYICKTKSISAMHWEIVWHQGLQ